MEGSLSGGWDLRWAGAGAWEEEGRRLPAGFIWSGPGCCSGDSQLLESAAVRATGERGLSHDDPECWKSPPKGMHGVLGWVGGSGDGMI